MGALKLPGLLGAVRSESFDVGTLGLWRTQPPGPVCISTPPVPRESHLTSKPGGFAPDTLAFGSQGTKLLKDIEKLLLKPYDDQTGKEITAWVAGATIGYGHLISKVDWPLYKDGITEAGADALFLADMAPFEALVSAKILVGLQQYEFDALVILAFNIGKGGFAGSSVVRLINDPTAITQYTDLEGAWKAWNKSQGQVMAGLDNRRRCEWAIFSMAKYERW